MAWECYALLQYLNHGEAILMASRRWKWNQITETWTRMTWAQAVHGVDNVCRTYRHRQLVAMNRDGTPRFVNQMYFIIKMTRFVWIEPDAIVDERLSTTRKQ